MTYAAQRSASVPGGGRVRAFFGVPLAPALRAAFEAEMRRLRAIEWKADPRFVAGEGLHVTLRFLGDVERSDADALAAAVARSVDSLPVFEVETGALALFPSSRRPRVLAAVLAPSRSLDELAARVEDAVVSFGFEPERRPFRGHVTLARFRGRPGRLPEPKLVLDALTLRVESVVLYRSELSQEGARYTELARLSLSL